MARIRGLSLPVHDMLGSGPTLCEKVRGHLWEAQIDKQVEPWILS